MNEQERGCDWSVLKTCAALNVWKVNLGKELWCPPWWSGSPKARTQRRVSRNIASTRVWWMSQHRRKPIAQLRDWGTEILTQWAGSNFVILRNTDKSNSAHLWKCWFSEIANSLHYQVLSISSLKIFWSNLIPEPALVIYAFEVLGHCMWKQVRNSRSLLGHVQHSTKNILLLSLKSNHCWITQSGVSINKITRPVLWVKCTI